MPVDRTRTSDVVARVAALEKDVQGVEQDADFDALGPRISDVERALRERIREDEAAVQAQREAFQRGHGVFARFLSGSARRQYQDTVGATEQDLERARDGALRLHRVQARFYDDKMRAHARAFIRVANKVQRNVGGGWDERALAAAARWLSARTGDAVIEAARRAQVEPAAGDGAGRAAARAPEVLLARLLSLEPPDALRARLAPLAAAVGADPLVLGAALLAGRSAADAAAVVDAMKVALAKAGALGTDPASSSLLCAAALLSAQPASSSAATVRAMANALPGMFDGAAPVVAAAVLAGTPVRDALDFAARVSQALAGAEGTASVVAAGLVAGRSVDDVVATAGEIERGVAGTSGARAALAAAGVLAGRPAGEVIAFAKHVQSQLTGTWESEAAVIGAGLLTGPGEPAPELVRRAFFLPGLVRTVDDD